MDSSSADLNVSRAISLAREICDTLNWQSDVCREIQEQQPNISPEDQASYSAFVLGDRIATFCGCLEAVGLTADAASISECAYEFRHAVWQYALTNASAHWSPDMNRWAQEQYGAFSSPVETDDDRELHELRGGMLVGMAAVLRDRVLAVKQTLADMIADAYRSGRRPGEVSAGATNAQKKAKRSTEWGEGQPKLIAALTKHHQYADGGCLNAEPIGNNELARLAGVDQATASAFFKRQFKGLGKYKAICADATLLTTALKLLNGEFAPHLLYGGKPPDEDDRGEE